AALVAFVAAVTGVLNWGLGLIVGAVLARDTGRGLRERGVRAHYPLLAAAGYAGLLVWHGGFSGSAPLKSATGQELSDLFGATEVARLGLTNGIPLGHTIGSPLNLVVTGG
ncbi:MAG: TIGR00366 family protein, partial [Xanthomonadales bacterium]|nr:TIGR00366 family protein [Xanthomonadales bacterium]NIO14094.1 TIGR00366 family protein [Xanthomonadales bacterium]NIQ35460.1 TIGR00366 family protein [Xanthomonadales bacterium]